MKLDHLNPFIESEHHLFTAMPSCGASKGNTELGHEQKSSRRETAALDLNGQRRQSK